MVYVTHDQAEAITMADQVVLMRAGRVEQCASPREIYEHPATAFAAGFIGTPPMNLVSGPVLLDYAARTDSAANNVAFTDQHTVGIRPEHVEIVQEYGLPATVEHVEYLGADLLAECRIGEATILARLPGSSGLRPRETVRLGWERSKLHLFDATNGQRLALDDHRAA